MKYIPFDHALVDITNLKPVNIMMDNEIVELKKDGPISECFISCEDEYSPYYKYDKAEVYTLANNKNKYPLPNSFFSYEPRTASFKLNRRVKNITTGAYDIEEHEIPEYSEYEIGFFERYNLSIEKLFIAALFLLDPEAATKKFDIFKFVKEQIATKYSMQNKSNHSIMMLQNSINHLHYCAHRSEKELEQTYQYGQTFNQEFFGLVGLPLVIKFKNVQDFYDHMSTDKQSVVQEFLSKISQKCREVKTAQSVASMLTL